MTAQAAASANQARAANYKYTSNMRNPPSQPTAMVAQPIQQAVHVKGEFSFKFLIFLVRFCVLSKIVVFAFNFLLSEVRKSWSSLTFELLNIFRMS